MQPGLNYSPPHPAENGPANRASIMMIVLGVLMLLMGFCFNDHRVRRSDGSDDRTVQNAVSLGQWDERRPAHENRHGGDGDRIGRGRRVVSVVWRPRPPRRKGHHRLSLVLCCLVGLFCVIEVLAQLVQMTRAPAAGDRQLACIAVPTIAIGLTLAWLIQALRVGPILRAPAVAASSPDVAARATAGGLRWIRRIHADTFASAAPAPAGPAASTPPFSPPPPPPSDGGSGPQ